MIEPEIAFCDLNLNMRVAEHMVKAVIEAVLAKCDEDMAFFHKRVDEGLMARLQKTLAGRPHAAVCRACRVSRVVRLTKRHATQVLSRR
jgi:aspartyl/asparaginyl-tRNA synthetase